MADALIGVTETSSTAKTIVDSLAQKYLIQQAKMMPLLSDFSNLVVKGASAVKIPRSGGFTPASKSENTAADASVITYAGDSISLNYHRYVQFLLEDIANIEASVDIVSDALMKASKDLALDVDKKLIDVLVAGASTSAPDHVIQYNDGTNEDLELVDILRARKLLIDQNIDPRECYMLISSAHEKDLLGIDNFISAEKYGSNQPIVNGEIGSVFGMKVVLHTYLTTKTVWFHPSACGFAFAQKARVQNFYDLAQLGQRWSIDYLMGASILDSGKRVVVMEETP